MTFTKQLAQHRANLETATKTILLEWRMITPSLGYGSIVMTKVTTCPRRHRAKSTKHQIHTKVAKREILTKTIWLEWWTMTRLLGYALTVMTTTMTSLKRRLIGDEERERLVTEAETSVA